MSTPSPLPCGLVWSMKNANYFLYTIEVVSFVVSIILMIRYS
jgi:hypothetical protein